jgi:hypothetical protein
LTNSLTIESVATGSFTIGPLNFIHEPQLET